MNKTILVIDDDKMLRNALAVGLRKNNFNVICAQSAESATEILHRVIVDAIVLDRMMDGQDGLSFLKDLRKQGDTTPVINPYPQTRRRAASTIRSCSGA